MPLPDISTFIILDNNALVGSNANIISKVVPSVFSTGTSVIGLYDVSSVGFEFQPNSHTGGIFQYRDITNSTTTILSVIDGTVNYNYESIHVGVGDKSGVDIFTQPESSGEGNIALNGTTGITKLLQYVDPATQDAVIQFSHGETTNTIPGTSIRYSSILTDTAIVSTITVADSITAKTINIQSSLVINTPDNLYNRTLNVGIYNGEPGLFLNNRLIIGSNFVNIQTVRF
jgi:hypothetical protein